MHQNEFTPDEAFRKRIENELAVRWPSEEHGEGPVLVSIALAWKPGYLAEGSFLALVDLGGEQRYSRVLFQVSDRGDQLIFLPLIEDQLREEGHERDELLSRLDFAPGADSWDEYLHDFVPLLFPGCLIARSEADLPLDYVPGPRSDISLDPLWFSPLYGLERALLAKALTDNACGVRAAGDGWIELQACALEGGKLSYRTFRIRTAPGGLPRGLVTVAEPGPPLMGGLPSTVCFPPGLGGGHDPIRRSIGAFGWEEISETESLAVWDDLRRLAAPLPAYPDSLSWRYLSFYGMEFVQLSVAEDGEPRPANFLWKPGYALPINGPEDIYGFNDRVAGEPGRGRLLRSADEAAEYAWFRHSCLFEEDLHIVTGKDDQALAGVDWSRPDEEGKTPLEAGVAERIAPPVAAEADGAAFAIRAYGLFGKALLEATLRYGHDGRPHGADAVGVWNFEELKQSAKPVSGLSAVSHGGGSSALRAEDLSGDRIENAIVVGKLRRREGLRVIRNARFRGEADLSGFVEDGSLTIEDCVFEAGLDLTAVRLGGGLTIRRCVFCRSNDGKALSLAHARCDSLTIEGASTPMQLSLLGLIATEADIRSTRCGGYLDLSDATIARRLYCNDIITGGDLILDGAAAERDSILLIAPFRVGGDLSAYSAQAGNHFIIGSDLGRGTVRGELSLSNSRVKSTLLVQNVEIGSRLMATYVHAGKIRCHGGRVKPYSARAALDAEAAGADADKAQKATPTADALRARGVADFTGARADDYFYLFDVEILGAAGGSSRKSLILRGLQTEGNCRLGATAAWFAENGFLHPEAEFRGVSAPMGIDLSQARIGGELDISGAQCAEGSITLDNISVTHDVACRDGSPQPARARRLSMNNGDFRGQVFLTHLETLPPKPSETDDAAGVSARFCAFARGLFLAEPPSGAEPSLASISGRLDLTGSEIAELHVSSRCFPEAEPWHRSRSGWSIGIHGQSTGLVLHQAKVAKLTSIIEGKAYPRPIDLSFAEIHWWDFKDQSGRRRGAAADYIELLKGDPKLQSHTFRSLEKNLADQGNEEAADRIRKAQREWLRAQPRFSSAHPLKHALLGPARAFYKASLWAWDLLTDSTTSPFRLVALIVAWMALSTVLFSNPANVEPSNAALQAGGGKARYGESPEAGEWDLMDGFWLAIRHHIPVAVFSAREDWQASAKPISLEAPSGGATLELALSAEDYANVVTGLHWILWPMVIVLASRKFFRSREK